MSVFVEVYFKQVNLAAGTVDHPELHTVNADAFVALRHSAKMMSHNATNSVEISTE